MTAEAASRCRRVVEKMRVASPPRTARQHLGDRRRREVGSGQPAEALVDAACRQQSLPAPGQREDRGDRDYGCEREVAEIGVREHVGRLADVDLPDDVRDRERGQQDRGHDTDRRGGCTHRVSSRLRSEGATALPLRLATPESSSCAP